MNKKKQLGLALIAMLPLTAMAEFNVSGEASISSSNVYRGIDTTYGSAAVKGTLELNYNGFYLSSSMENDGVATEESTTVDGFRFVKVSNDASQELRLESTMGYKNMSKNFTWGLGVKTTEYLDTKQKFSPFKSSDGVERKYIFHEDHEKDEAFVHLGWRNGESETSTDSTYVMAELEYFYDLQKEHKNRNYASLSLGIMNIIDNGYSAKLTMEEWEDRSSTTSFTMSKQLELADSDFNVNVSLTAYTTEHDNDRVQNNETNDEDGGYVTVGFKF